MRSLLNDEVQCEIVVIEQFFLVIDVHSVERNQSDELHLVDDFVIENASSCSVRLDPYLEIK